MSGEEFLDERATEMEEPHREPAFILRTQSQAALGQECAQ
jgi:hypothetical protein